MSNEDYPTTAFILTLIGAILSLIYGFVYVITDFYAVGALSMILPGLAWFGSVCIVLGVIGGVMALVAAFLMKDPERAHTGGVLAIISAFLAFGGILTFILLLIGGILALMWKKPEKKAVVLPPPPPN